MIEGIIPGSVRSIPRPEGGFSKDGVDETAAFLRPQTDVYIPETNDTEVSEGRRPFQPMPAEMAYTLGEKYPITDMTRSEYGSLLRELRDAGVITSQEFGDGYGGMTPYMDVEGKTAYGGTEGWPMGKEKADFAELVQSCANACEAFISGQEKPAIDMKPANPLSNSYCRLAKILNQIKEASLQGKESDSMEINRMLNGQTVRPQSYQQKTTTGQSNNTFQEQLAAQAAEMPSGIAPKAVTASARTVPALASVSHSAKPSVNILSADSIAVKLEELKRIADDADYTGMSYEEIYTTIWNRYEDAFGKNLPAILSRLGPVPKGWFEIANQFSDETSKAVFKPLFREFREQGLIKKGESYDRDDTYIMQRVSDIESAPFGYSGMSFEEKEQAIYEKYRGRNSYIDFLNMQGELRLSSVYLNRFGDDGADDYLSILHCQLTDGYVYKKFNLLDQLRIDPYPANQLTEGEWKQLFSEKFDVVSFYKDFKESLKVLAALNNHPFDIESMISDHIDELIEFLGKDRR